MRGRVSRAIRDYFRKSLKAALPGFVEVKRARSTGILFAGVSPSGIKLFVEVLIAPRMDAFTVHLVLNSLDESVVAPEYLDPVEAASRPLSRLALFRFWDQSPGRDPWYWKPSALDRFEGLADYLVNEPSEEEVASELLSKAQDATAAVVKYGAPYFGGVA